ncbi:MAG: CDP-diacylglycerol--glycerol-3-phosphate 3-phosphatidyltransferase, partial [Rhodopirellula bahusiensis]
PVPMWLGWTAWVLLWGAIGLTVYSGVDYTLIAARVMQSDAGLEVPAEPSVASANPDSSQAMHNDNLTHASGVGSNKSTASSRDDANLRSVSNELPTQ